MTREEALQFKNEVIRKCEDKGVWYEVRQSNRPKLKEIEISMKIKVEEEKAEGKGRRV